MPHSTFNNTSPGYACMEADGSRTTLQPFDENQSLKKVAISHNCWKRRTYLEKCFIISFLIFLFLIGGLILVIIIQNMNFIKAKDALIDPQELCQTTACLKVSARVSASIDSQTNPCLDFYNFACGGWKKTNPIPEGFYFITETYNSMAMDLMNSLRDIFSDDQLSQNNSSSALAKANDFYQSCLNTKLINERGFEPGKKLLKEFGGFQLQNTWNGLPFDLTDLLAKLMEYNFAPIFDISLIINSSDPSKYALMIDVPQESESISTDMAFIKSLNMKPQRKKTFVHENVTPYWNKGSRRKKSTELPHIHDMWAAYYESNTTKFVDALYKLMSVNGIVNEEYIRQTLTFINVLNELSIPKLNERKSLRFPKSTMTVAQLYQLLPEVSWEKILQRFLKEPVSLNDVMYVSNPELLKNISQLTKHVDDRTLHNTLLALFVKNVLLELLSSQTNTGLSRWEFCIKATKNVFGEVVTAAYLKTLSKSKLDDYADKMADMFINIKEAFTENLKSLKWMDKVTLNQTLEKIESMDKNLVTSSLFLNESYIESTAENLTINEYFFENVINSYKRARIFLFKLYRKAVDKNMIIWTIISIPITINAFYLPTFNTIVVPLGILNPPYFDLDAPKSINYGAIGSTLGHEITHAIDSVGSTFDKYGRQISKWSDRTEKNFLSKADCFMKQYGSIKLSLNFKKQILNVSIDGDLTLDENIADNGGLKASLEAYRKWITKHGNEKQLPGLQLTPEQLFFVSSAQVYCGHFQPAAYLFLLQTDEHTPHQERVNAMMQNSYDFSDVFHCPKGSPMNPTEKCALW